MIGCLRTRVRKQPIIALYFEFETVLKFYNLRADRMWVLSWIQNVLHSDNVPEFFVEKLKFEKVSRRQQNNETFLSMQGDEVAVPYTIS